MPNYFFKLLRTFFSAAAIVYFFSIFPTYGYAQEAPDLDAVEESATDFEHADFGSLPESKASPAQKPVAPVEEKAVTYTVKKGDSLYVIAKRHGVTVGNLKKTNNLTSDLIKPEMVLKIPNSNFSILVDKSDNTLKLFSNGQLYKTYSVSTGENNSTPVGTFKVTDKLENPTWYTAGAVVKPGSPDNILGTRWIGYSLKGYGIHGTTLPETIGTQASAGCVRMHNADVEELYDLIPPGTVVTVQD